VLGVDVDGQRVHVQQALVGSVLHGPGLLQVPAGLGLEVIHIEWRHVPGGHGVAGEVHVHPPTGRALLVHRDVHQRGTEALETFGVERPLVAFEERVRRHLPHGLVVVVQEIPFIAAVGVGAEVAGNHLLVGAGQVPSEADRGQTELALGEVVRRAADLQGQPVASHLPLGIHRVPVHLPRSTCGEDHVARQQEDETIAGAADPSLVDGQGSDHAALIPTAARREQADDLKPVQDCGAIAPDVLEAVGHHLDGGLRACGGGALAGVMVGLVPHVGAIPVVREGDTVADEMEELRQ